MSRSNSRLKSLSQHSAWIAFFRSANYERQILSHNRWDFSLVFWIPLLVLFLVWWVFSRSHIVDLPIGVIDEDNGRVASTLVQYLDTSPDLEVVARFNSPAEAKKALLERQVYGVVIIPSDFNQNLLSAKPAPVVLQVMLNLAHTLVLSKEGFRQSWERSQQAQRCSALLGKVLRPAK